MNLTGRFIKGTGSYEVKEASSDEGLIKKGDKYLECTSSGTVGFPSDVAYGEWEFDIYQSGSTNMLIGIINDKKEGYINSLSSGYDVHIQSDHSIRLREIHSAAVDIVLSLSMVNHMPANKWYRIKTTRTKDGEFTLYIKGGDFSTENWTLVDASSIGTNPITDNTYTTSKYFALDLDAGDRIANISIKNEVRQ